MKNVFYKHQTKNPMHKMFCCFTKAVNCMTFNNEVVMSVYGDRYIVKEGDDGVKQFYLVDYDGSIIMQHNPTYEEIIHRWNRLKIRY